MNRLWEKIRHQLPSFEKGSQGRRLLIEFVTVYTGLSLTFSHMTICVGPSMIPTINPEGELAFIDRFLLVSGDYKVDDVVISKNVTDPSKSKTFVIPSDAYHE
jgi:hypothetical protein